MSRFRLVSSFRSHFSRASVLLALASLALGACGKKQEGGAEGGGGAPGAMPPAQVTAMTVTPTTVAIPYEFTGTIEGSREVEVRARVSGILLKRVYEEGRPVRKGEVLFLIDPAEYRAKLADANARLAEMQANLSRAERDVARLEPLLAAHATSRKDFDNAVSEKERAAAALLSAQALVDQAKLDLAYTRVEAPISGLSSRAEHSEGSLVEPGDNGLLTRISQVHPIWVRFGVPDQTLLNLRKQIADRTVKSPGTDQLEVQLALPDGTVHPERGRVNFSDSMIDAQTGSVALRAQLPNSQGSLIPGQFVRVRLQGIERPGAIVIPQRAVQQGPQGKFVFVVGGDGNAAIKPVEAGAWIGQDWIIESGLAAGDKVIVDGAIKVQPGAPVQVVDPSQAAPQGGPAGTPGAAPAEGGAPSQDADSTKGAAPAGPGS